MPVEMLTYAELGERLKISPEAARALAKRHRLPRSRSNHGKTLVQIDLAEINHAPLPARSSAGHQAVTPLKAKIETLQAKLAKLEAVAGGRRADFEWERDQGQKLMAEFLKMIAATMSAKEVTARGRASSTEVAAVVESACRVTSSYLSRQCPPGAAGTIMFDKPVADFKECAETLMCEVVGVPLALVGKRSPSSIMNDYEHNQRHGDQ